MAEHIGREVLGDRRAFPDPCQEGVPGDTDAAAEPGSGEVLPLGQLIGGGLRDIRMLSDIPDGQTLRLEVLVRHTHCVSVLSA